MACVSDSWLRLPMPVGPWQEPVGEDCYMNLVAFRVLASIVLALDIIALFLCLSESVLASNKMVRLHNGVCVLVLGTNIALISSGFVAQQLGFVMWAAFICSVILIVITTQRIFILSTMSTIAKVSNKNLVGILGGQWIVLVGALHNITALIIVVVGSVGAAVASLNDDVPETLRFWQVMCVGGAYFSGGFLLTYSYGLGQFASLIENTMSNTLIMSSNPTQMVEMNDLSRRFRLASRIVLLFLPLGVGAWCLCAFVIPMWWWLVLLQSLNVVGGMINSWWSFTPLARRARILPCLKRSRHRAMLLHQQSLSNAGIGIMTSVHESSGDATPKSDRNKKNVGSAS